MDMIKMEINGRMYDVVNLDEYQKNPDAFVPEITITGNFILLSIIYHLLFFLLTTYSLQILNAFPVPRI